MSAEKVGRKIESLYPISIKLKGKRVLICGGHLSALSEASRLVEFGAFVDVVAPHMMAELQEMAVSYGDRISLHRRAFDQSDAQALKTDKYALCFAFAHDAKMNAEMIAAANAGKVPIFSQEDVDASDYVVPSVLKRGHLKIAVSTDGISPALERAVMQRIEAMFVSEIDNYTLFLTRLQEITESASRDQVLGRTDTYSKLMRTLAQSEEILLALQRKNFEEAHHLAEAIVAQAKTETTESATHQ